MKVVIDIEEDIYEDVKKTIISDEIFDEIVEAFRHGTPLPKGHRGIVDLKSVQWAFNDAILEEAQRTGQVRATHNEIARILGAVPTIIEADKAESEEV